MLNRISYRTKIPLSLVVTIVVTALVVAVPLINAANQAARRDAIDNALSLGRTLSRTLQPALIHDELWQAFEILRIPFPEGDDPSREAIVLDSQHAIFVSSAPRAFPSTRLLASSGPPYVQLVERVRSATTQESLVLEDVDPARIFLVIPILADDQTRLGSLLMGYSRSIFLPRFYDTIRRAAVSTLLVLAGLLPIGWLWGGRIAQPLRQLAQTIARIPHQAIQTIHFTPTPGRDEIASLSARFAEMLDELKQKALFEKEVVASERLAAVGRMTAGIAHEINNPLGGMLNAISTYRRHRGEAAIIDTTVSLLERGLRQIQEAVSALLVEARLSSHALTPQDIEDTRTLVHAQMHEKSIEIRWENDLREPVALPSTEVRQILLNLLLNATQAAHHGGHVRCRVQADASGLTMTVANNGERLSAEQLEHLFEPFAPSNKGGKGLGLWMIYQLVTQLNGRVDVTPAAESTTFEVWLPVKEPA